MLKVAPLQGAFGVRIEGLDLSRALESRVVKEVVDLFYEHQVMVIPNQSLTPEQFESFCCHFGRPHPHVIQYARMKGHPTIVPLTNKTKDGAEPAQGAAHWHTDQSYEAEPASATILYSIEAPETGGETLFADMFRAYEDLPEETRILIEGLRAKHLYGRGVAARKEDYQPAPLQSQEESDAVPGVEHLLARPHPVTGRKALYSPAGTSRGIAGMKDEEAAALLNELADHALQSKYIYKHRYAVGDVVGWDTSSTMHAATPIGPATGPRDTRYLHRISVKGKPGIYR